MVLVISDAEFAIGLITAVVAAVFPPGRADVCWVGIDISQPEAVSALAVGISHPLLLLFAILASRAGLQEVEIGGEARRVRPFVQV